MRPLWPKWLGHHFVDKGFRAPYLE